MTHSPQRLWDELRVTKDIAADFFAVFARFEYALKRSGFLKAGRRAQPDWNCFARTLVRECTEESVKALFDSAAYLVQVPAKRQVVDGNTLGWEPLSQSDNEASLPWLFEVVRTTRNNLLHGGKFKDGPEAEPARDEKLIAESTKVLLGCLKLDCDSARLVAEEFWRFDAAG
jgi:hypothetical protein